MENMKLYIVHDPKYHSLIRPAGKENREKAEDPRWTMPRFLERIEQRVPTELIAIPGNPPKDAKAVWFALPDPLPHDLTHHYMHWAKGFEGKLVNHPETTCMNKREWYWFLNMHGIRAPHPTPTGWFTKTLFHGRGPKFSCEYIESRHINAINPQADNPNHKVWRIVYSLGKVGDKGAYFEESGYWVQSGGASVRELQPVPKPMVEMVERIAEVSGLGYFHVEIIPSPWVGPVVCDVNPHPFDVLEGKLNNVIIDHTVDTLDGWLNG